MKKRSCQKIILLIIIIIIANIVASFVKDDFSKGWLLGSTVVYGLLFL